MRLLPDSYLAVLVAALLMAGPAVAAMAKKPVKPPVKPAAKAAAVDPQPDPVSLIAQARDAQGKGDIDLAVRLAQAAIVADPSRSSAYDALGDVYAAAHVPDAARSYYDEALSIDPTDMPAQKAIAALTRGANDTRAANAEGIKTGNP